MNQPANTRVIEGKDIFLIGNDFDSCALDAIVLYTNDRNGYSVNIEGVDLCLVLAPELTALCANSELHYVYEQIEAQREYAAEKARRQAQQRELDKARLQEMKRVYGNAVIEAWLES